MIARIRYYWEEYQRPLRSLALAIILIPICLWVHVAWLIVPAIFILRASRQAYYINRLLHNPVYLGWKLGCKLKQQTGQPIITFDEHCNRLLDAINNNQLDFTCTKLK